MKKVLFSWSQYVSKLLQFSEPRSVKIIALIPYVEPLFLAMKPWLVLVEVVKVDQSVGAVAFCTSIVSVQLAPANALSATFFFPDELVRFEIRAFVRAIAPRLLLAFTTGAPVVGFALFHLDLVAASFWHLRQH